MSILKLEKWVPHPIEEVFSFYSDVHNLEKMCPPWMHFKILSCSTPLIEKDTVFEYSMKAFGVPFIYKSKIEDIVQGEYFIDSQIKGPFSSWWHKHSFESLNSGTLIKDEVHFKAPLGFVGKLILGPPFYLGVQQIFKTRDRLIDKVFPSE
jgi:ligand-binding SRPBCC domain-containing protein